MKNLFQIIDIWAPRVCFSILLIINLAIAANIVRHISEAQYHCAIPGIVIGALFLWLTILICKKL